LKVDELESKKELGNDYGEMKEEKLRRLKGIKGAKKKGA